MRVVVDTNGRLPPESHVFSGPGTALWVVGEGAKARTRRREVEVVELPRLNRRVDLRALLLFLGRREVHNALFEGGGTILGNMFDRGLVDKVAAFVAPVILGGDGAPGPVRGTGVEDVSRGQRLIRMRRRHVGQDTLITGYVPGNRTI